jgi:hypothetical protein
MELKEGIDYYINEDGNFVFTEAYHLKRGYCCKNKCLHCPWHYGREEQFQPPAKSPPRKGRP